MATSLRSAPALVLFLALVSAVLVMAQVTPPPPATPADGGESPLTPPETPQPPADIVPIIPDLPVPGIGGIPGIGSGSGHRAKCERCKAGCHRKRGFAKLICKGLCGVKCTLKVSDEVFSCTQNCADSVSPTVFTDAHDVNDHINSCYQSCKI